LPIDSLIQRITRKLHKSLDIVEQSSRWAVESWAVALGLLKLDASLTEPPCQPGGNGVPETKSASYDAPGPGGKNTANSVGPLPAFPEGGDPAKSTSDRRPPPVSCPNCDVPLAVDVPLSEIVPRPKNLWVHFEPFRALQRLPGLLLP
jgi:hypothetical protein